MQGSHGPLDPGKSLNLKEEIVQVLRMSSFKIIELVPAAAPEN